MAAALGEAMVEGGTTREAVPTGTAVRVLLYMSATRALRTAGNRRNAGGEGEIIVLFQNFRFFLLDLCVGTAPQNLETTPQIFGDHSLSRPLGGCCVPAVH